MNYSYFSRSNKRKKLVSEINITPFVDVLLVLLIIFMIAAPMLTGSIKLNLPETSNKSVSKISDPIIISINNENKIFLQDKEVEINNIRKKILEITKNKKEKIYIKGDKNIHYGAITNIIDSVNKSGFSQVILVTKLDQ